MVNTPVPVYMLRQQLQNACILRLHSEFSSTFNPCIANIHMLWTGSATHFSLPGVKSAVNSTHRPQQAMPPERSP